MDPRIELIRDVIDALSRVENGSNDEKEIVYDRELAKIAQMDRSNALDIANRAIGKGKKRRRYSPYIFAELYDVPGIEQIFQDLLETSDSDGRSEIIQTIGHRNLTKLVPTLNSHFVKESDDFCRDRLLTTLGKLASPSSLPIFEYLIHQGNPKDEWFLLVAAKNYNHQVFEAFVNRVFASPTAKKSHKILAAWTIAKTGDSSANQYLIEMLDDPAIKTVANGVTTFDPGESIRAAQAIADINGWEFEWNTASVDAAKDRLKNRSS